ASLEAERKAALEARLQTLLRTNTYDFASRQIVVDPIRAEAFAALSRYYSDVFSRGRDEYAIQPGQMSSFFWWTAWAASTNRPGTDVTYTQNWPHEPLIANQPTGSTIVWSVISFFLLLAGIGGMVWCFASQP